MATGLPLLVLGAALIAVGAAHGGWAWLAAWLGGDFLLLGGAHLWRRPLILGKRPDGRLALWGWTLFCPLLAFTHLVWSLSRLLSREPAVDKVRPGFFIGRRLLSAEADARGPFDNHVDLTSEFAEPAPLRRRAGYVSLPILDGSAPSAADLRRVIRGLRPGTTFIHCAQGHGRTALFAAALLVETGAASGAEEALALVRRARPGVRLNRSQLRFLRDFAGS